MVDADGNDITDEGHIGNKNPYRYRGYYYDADLKLYWLQTRYYDPETGRFVTIDDISYLDPETINGLNLYAYCGNNPVMRTDATGCLPQWLGWLLTGLILVGLAVATVFTFGAAAPITGIAAAMVVGATIGATVGFAASIVTQGIVNGWDNINSWQVFTDTVIGGVGGALSGAASTTASIGIRLGLKGAQVALSGAGAAIDGIIEGKSPSEILRKVGISIAIGILIQGMGLILDGRMGKLSNAVVELMILDGAFTFGLNKLLSTAVSVVLKTIWKYIQEPIMNGIQSILVKERRDMKFKNEESKEETLDGKEIEQQYENFIVCWVVRRIKQNGKREGFAKSEII